jgi:hypothetical protein
MLKLLQEVRGFAQFRGQPIEPRPASPLLLQFRGALRRRGPSRRRYAIRIEMQEPPDIPHPVPIIHLGEKPR